eukprot:365874-Chlamydomonas_euryale.AAC.20
MEDAAKQCLAATPLSKLKCQAVSAVGIRRVNETYTKGQNQQAGLSCLHCAAFGGLTFGHPFVHGNMIIQDGVSLASVRAGVCSGGPKQGAAVDVIVGTGKGTRLVNWARCQLRRTGCMSQHASHGLQLAPISATGPLLRPHSSHKNVPVSAWPDLLGMC